MLGKNANAIPCTTVKRGRLPVHVHAWLVLAGQPMREWQMRDKLCAYRYPSCGEGYRYSTRRYPAGVPRLTRRQNPGVTTEKRLKGFRSRVCFSYPCLKVQIRIADLSPRAEATMTKSTEVEAINIHYTSPRTLSSPCHRSTGNLDMCMQSCGDTQSGLYTLIKGGPPDHHIRYYTPKLFMWAGYLVLAPNS